MFKTLVYKGQKNGGIVTYVGDAFQKALFLYTRVQGTTKAEMGEAALYWSRYPETRRPEPEF